MRRRVREPRLPRITGLSRSLLSSPRGDRPSADMRRTNHHQHSPRSPWCQARTLRVTLFACAARSDNGHDSRRMRGDACSRTLGSRSCHKYVNPLVNSLDHALNSPHCEKDCATHEGCAAIAYIHRGAKRQEATILGSRKKAGTGETANMTSMRYAASGRWPSTTD
jgi:hypothetical protein